MVIGIVAMVLALLVGGLVSRNREDYLVAAERSRLGRRMSAVSASLTAQINQRQAMTAGLAAFAELHGSETGISEDFAIYAAGLHANDAVVRAVQVFPRRGRQLVYPKEGNEAVLGITLQDLLNDNRPGLKEDLQRTIETHRITLSRPYELRQGGLGVVARQAIFRGGELWGIAVIIINVEPLLNLAGLPLLSDLDVCLRDTQGQVFFGPPGLVTHNPVSQTVSLPEGSWTISSVPRGGWGAADRQEIVLYRLSSVLSALLVGTLVYFSACRLTALARTVNAQNQRLDAHEKDYRRLFEEAENARARAEEANAESRRLLDLAEQSRGALLSVVEDQKEAETALRASARVLRLRGLALEAAANAIVITDHTGAVEWANPAFTALSGWTVDEVIGRNLRDFVKSGEHGPEFYRRMWTTLLEGQVWRGEIINRRKDGTKRTEEMTITPVRDEGGAIRHFIAIKQDITERRSMEAQFLQAQRMEAIGTLAGGIAHDLNNILAPIMMVTGVLQEKLTNEKERDLLTITESGVQRGAEIIKQLLTFSRGQSGERIALQPRHLAKEVMVIMRETFPREISLELNLAEDLWMVVADPTQLHQVLLNLCVNARDAMPAGGKLTLAAANVTIAASDPALPPTAQPGSYVVITVRDTGHGISPEIKHRIFDPFFTTKPLGQGTGLGLSTVLGIVGSHGGFVKVDSAVNEGTAFKIYWPATPDGPEPVAETPAAPQPARGKRHTILVVDDERHIRDATRLVLEGEFDRVLLAADGADALAQYLANRPEISLVLTDLMMPVMDGMALIRTLRVIDPKLAILAATGLNDPVKRNDLESLGVPPVLQKPFDGATLLAAVNRHLQDA